jgi:hypothetical protein
MYILFADFVKDFSADFYIRSDATFPKTVIAFEKNLFSKAMLHNVALYNPENIFVSPGKTGTAKTNNNFTAMTNRTDGIEL